MTGILNLMLVLVLFASISSTLANIPPSYPQKMRGGSATPFLPAATHVAIPLSRRGDGGNTPSVLNTTENWFTQRIDHLTSDMPPGGELTFEQRYYVYDGYFKGSGAGSSPIFFYCGNEADVTLYVNSSGLMWERAQEFGALLVWAEHRYYGESLPFGSLEESSEHRSYLSVEQVTTYLETRNQPPFSPVYPVTSVYRPNIYIPFHSFASPPPISLSSQALADFAALVPAIKEQYTNEGSSADSSAVVAFGGSYGGMLASWMRLKVFVCVKCECCVCRVCVLRHLCVYPDIFNSSFLFLAPPPLLSESLRRCAPFFVCWSVSFCGRRRRCCVRPYLFLRGGNPGCQPKLLRPRSDLRFDQRRRSGDSMVKTHKENDV